MSEGFAYIIARRTDGNVLFWRVGAAGYTERLEDAGIWPLADAHKQISHVDEPNPHQVVPCELIHGITHTSVKVSALKQAMERQAGGEDQ